MRGGRNMIVLCDSVQGKKESEYLAFTSRNKENKKYYSYLFMAKNSKMVMLSGCVCVCAVPMFCLRPSKY